MRRVIFWWRGLVFCFRRRLVVWVFLVWFGMSVSWGMSRRGLVLSRWILCRLLVGLLFLVLLGLVGVLRCLRVMGRLLILFRDSCLAPYVWCCFFRRWSAGLSLSFPVWGLELWSLLETDASAESKPTSHGKITVERQETQELQPWVTHRQATHNISAAHRL